MEEKIKNKNININDSYFFIIKEILYFLLNVCWDYVPCLANNILMAAR